MNVNPPENFLPVLLWKTEQPLKEGAKLYKNPLTQMNSHSPSFSKVDQKIADYILDHPDEISRYNIGKLAKEIGVADSSIIRFTQKIGYSGFREFKIALAATANHNQNDDAYFGDVSEGSASMENILKGMLSGHIKNAEMSMRELDFEMIDQVAQLFLEKEHIYFVGAGPSGLVAESAYMHFRNISNTVHLSRDKFSMVQDSFAMTDKDLIVVVSQTGEAEHVKTLVELAHERGITVVALTSTYDTTIYKHADYPIVVGSTFTNPGTRYFATDVMFHIIFDSIYIFVEFYMQKNKEGHRNWIFDHFRPLL